MEKTSLEVAIEKVKEIEESFFRNDLSENYETLKNGLLNIASTSDIFVNRVNQRSRGEVVKLDIELAGIHFGRVFLEYDSFNETLNLSASNFRMNEHREEFHIIEREDHVMVATPISENHVLIQEPMLANKKFINLLTTKLVERIVSNFNY